MFKLYGTNTCSDCLPVKEALKVKGVDFEYVDIMDNLYNLKEFLTIRDLSDKFNKVREYHTIGIPCIKNDSEILLGSAVKAFVDSL